MQVQDIQPFVIKTLTEQFVMRDVGVKLTDKLHADLGMDSLDSIELLMSLEDALHIEIPDEEAEKLTTVQEVIDYSTEKVKSCSPFMNF